MTYVIAAILAYFSLCWVRRSRCLPSQVCAAGVLAELDPEGVAAVQDAIVQAVQGSSAQDSAQPSAGELQQYSTLPCTTGSVFRAQQACDCCGKHCVKLQA